MLREEIDLVLIFELMYYILYVYKSLRDRYDLNISFLII